VTDNNKPLLPDLGPAVFVPAEADPCRRWESYYTALIVDIEALQAASVSDDADEDWYALETRLLARLTQGQRLAYLLGSFDDQILNGGVAQFIFNCGQLAQEVLTAFRQLGLSEVEAAVSTVLAQTDAGGLEEARRVFSGDFAQAGDASISPEAYAAYERERLRIERAAEAFEDGWLGECDDNDVFHEGPLRVAMCEALNAYIKAHPREFQVLKK
jgi:hypothetical protein